MLNNIIILQNINEYDVNTFFVNNDNDIIKKIFIIGNIINSIEYIEEKSYYILSNIHAIAINTNIILFYGNKDLQNLSLCHSLLMMLLNNNRNIILKFNNGCLNLTYENYKLLGYKVFWFHDSKFFNNISKYKYTKNIGDYYTFYERFNQIFHISGTHIIFIECIFSELKLSNNIFSECKDNDDLINYKSFIILGIFNSMFIKKLKINTHFKSIITNFRKDLNQEHFNGLLLEIFLSNKNIILKYYKHYLISHSGITNKILNFFDDNNDILEFFKLSMHKQINFFNFNFDSNTNLFIDDINLTDYFFNYHKYSVKYTIQHLINFEKICNDTLHILIKKIIIFFDFSDFILFKCLFTDLHPQIILYNTPDSNLYRLIGPGFIEYIHNWKKINFSIYKDNTYKKNINIIQIIGNNPLSCSNCFYYNIKNNNIININTSNLFNNSNIITITQNCLHFFSKISINFEKNVLLQKIYNNETIINDIISQQIDTLYVESLISDNNINLIINIIFPTFIRYNSYLIYIDNIKFILIIHGNTNINLIFASLISNEKYFKIFFLISNKKMLNLIIHLKSYNKFIYKYFKKSYIKYLSFDIY